MDERKQGMPAEVAAGKRVGREQLQEWTRVLQTYKAGKKSVENRVIESEQWWKLRHGGVSEDKAFQSKSAWLHNVVVSKHADAMAAYPQPGFLPREASDRQAAEELSSIVPVILQQNRFKKTYDKLQWEKQKFGTGVYKIIWDGRKLNGLGDIGIEAVSLLNVFWEPGVEDIQNSKYFFHAELMDKDLLKEQYPWVEDELKGKGFLTSKFIYDDNVPTDNKVTVIEIYYHKAGKLHYCKYVGTTVLYATENDPALAERGLYDHGKFPYAFDDLYPVEGSPCGYGFVDVCRNPQTEIDLMNTAILKNTMAGATPRFFVRQNAGVNKEQLLDLTNPIVETVNGLGEDSVRVIDYQPLQGNYIGAMEHKINELRETSGNTETSTGSTSSGVTAASAIAALQEASGKGSRDATERSWEVFTEVVNMCVELIRQFYTAPRKFRITNKQGQEEFITYQNGGLQPQVVGQMPDGSPLTRMPVFDIEITAQKQNAYTTLANNEMAIQFFQLGFFDPARTDQTLMCLEMMDFRGKQEIVSKVRQMGDMNDRMQLLMSYAAALAAKHQDAAALQQLAQIAGVDPGPVMAPMGGVNVENAAGGAEGKKEHAAVEKSRRQSREASQPGEGA